MKVKHILIVAFLLVGCSKNSHDGTYVCHINGDYALVDDTLILKDSVVINHTGYQKIRKGILQKKQFKSNRWSINSLNAPAMQFKSDKIILGQTTYTRLP